MEDELIENTDPSTPTLTPAPTGDTELVEHKEESEPIKEPALNQRIIKFQAIFSFVSEINQHLGKHSHNLRLYCRLLEKTTFKHTDAINKHIAVFTRFCKLNDTALLERDLSKCVDPKIIYSPKTFIDLGIVFEHADPDQRNVMWKHLLTIYHLVDPTSGAREALRALSQMPETKNETDFINNMMNKIQNNVDLSDASDPMKAVSKIMSSGIFNELVQDLNQNIESGELDVAQLTKTIGGLLNPAMLQAMGPLAAGLGAGGLNGLGGAGSSGEPPRLE